MSVFKHSKDAVAARLKLKRIGHNMDASFMLQVGEPPAMTPVRAPSILRPEDMITAACRKTRYLKAAHMQGAEAIISAGIELFPIPDKSAAFHKFILPVPAKVADQN